MKVAMIGLGKLGLPVSCAMVQKGHEVFGYDVDNERVEYYRSCMTGLYEPDMDAVLEHCLQNGLHIVDSIEEAVRPAEIVFIAVPTPSVESGAFDTTIVQRALAPIASVMSTCDDYKVVSIISTVLPGTTRRDFLPVLGEVLGEPPGDRYGLCYNAQFIAMGTVIADFLYPEFVLVGEIDAKSGDVLGAFYSSCIDAPILRMSLESAETVKMSYNCYIGSKLVIANAIMELCHNVPGADATVVSQALQKANRRIAGTSYMVGGMGDGGNCLPAGQIVITENGPRPIEQVKQGDLVMVADGSFEKVVGTWWRKYDGELVALNVRGFPPVEMTPNHRLDAMPDGGEPMEMSAGDLTTGHFLAFPVQDDPSASPVWHPVTCLWRRHFKGTVYNLWVEPSNTYVTCAGTVHNCHGRDNLALSFLAGQVGLSADPFGYTQKARDQQSRGMARLVARETESSGLPVAILGLTFKPKTNLTDFSAPLLLIDHLKELGVDVERYDPIIGPYELPHKPYVYVLAMRHEVLKSFDFCPGSVIVDPWRMLDNPPDGCKYVPVGIGK